MLGGLWSERNGIMICKMFFGSVISYPLTILTALGVPWGLGSSAVFCVASNDFPPLLALVPLPCFLGSPRGPM